MATPVLLGASGRAARAVRRVWAREGIAPVTVSRSSGADIGLVWDMADAPPPLPRARGRAVFVMAGVTPRSGGDLDRNTDLALTGIAAARRWGAAHVFAMSSSSVCGDTGPDPVAEDAPVTPAGAYGTVKLRMERALAAEPGVTVLRLANIAGLSEPFDTLRAAPASAPLHRFADGEGPSRSYVGPVLLARVMAGLTRHAETGAPLPALLHVAAPRPTRMQDIFVALGVAPDWAPAPAQAVQHVHLDTARLATLCELPPSAGAAANLIAEARAT